MRLARLEVDGFRNLRRCELDLAEGLTVVVGDNGQGKTSLLEAIYVLGTGRSFRTRRVDDMVAWDGGPARAAGRVEHRLGASRLAVLLEATVRRLLVDDVEQPLESYLGRLDVVDLTEGRMAVLRGAPPERRRFLDRGIVGLRPGYLRDLGRYRRVLAHRNALLRRGSTGPGHELAAWDERLRDAAIVLHGERRRYAGRLDERLGEVARELLAEGRTLRLRYRPSPAAAAERDPGEFGELLAEALAASHARDRELGHTARGPHRDELTVELDGVDLRRFGSAGQLRAAMIALKLSKLSLLREERGESPVLLLDDFDTDLDEVRASALADFLRRGEFQALVASSKPTLLGRLGVAFSKLSMEEGTIRTG